MITEKIPVDQKETSIETDIIRPPADRPFVCMTITGPENSLCLRLNRSTVRMLMERMKQLHRELRN